MSFTSDIKESSSGNLPQADFVECAIYDVENEK